MSMHVFSKCEIIPDSSSYVLCAKSPAGVALPVNELENILTVNEIKLDCNL